MVLPLEGARGHLVDQDLIRDVVQVPDELVGDGQRSRRQVLRQRKPHRTQSTRLQEVAPRRAVAGVRLPWLYPILLPFIQA